MKEIYQELLDMVNGGDCLLTAVETHKDIPTIHNFYPKKYYSSITHLGFGCFDGKTENGTFSFNAGGSMFKRNGFAWTFLFASAEVLKDLGYDIEKVKKALAELIEGSVK